MERDKPMYISLTGEKSHKVTIPAGQGSFSIGTKEISEGKYDVWVEKDSPINWNAFNEFYTLSGKQNAERYPNGNWPRFFYYSGNDKGFIDWSFQRKIEDFHWTPKENLSVDLTKANINRFFLHTEANIIELSIGDSILSLFLSGNLENIYIERCTIVPRLSFAPFFSKIDPKPYQLPIYKSLEKTTSVEISSSPIGQAFDCKSILQFSNLTSLNLSGNLVNLEALAELKHLERIGLRFVPDLTDMPKLTTWKSLKSFIGWNIEETAGKVLKTELNALSKEKELDYSNVSKLRKTIWFITEYGIPFSGWEDKSAKIATKAYKVCLKEVKKLKKESEIRKAIIEFVEVINKLPNIETSEREDVGIAVSQLVKSSVLDISEETGNKWFDEIRDF